MNRPQDPGGAGALPAAGAEAAGALARGARRPAAVAIMARSPAGARAPKRRLRAAVPEDADRRRLYAAFLTDTLAAGRALPGVAVRVARTPDGGDGGFAALGLAPAELMVQRGGDLGARERAVFDDLFAAGFAAVVLIGSDLPTLPPAHLDDAFARLRPGAAVLGPAADGGYYLIGLTAPPPGAAVPDLFTGIRWGTAAAFADTVRAAARAGVQVERAPAWYDVDDAAGLARLRRDLAAADGAARAPATARVLADLAAAPPPPPAGRG